MKAITSTLAIFLFSISLFAGNGEDEKNTLNVNTKKSKIYWTGKKVTGEHTGTLMLKSGNVTIEDGIPTGATMNIDMGTIVVTDLEDPGTNAKLTGHLNSPDFFSTEKFPEGQFVATNISPIKGAKGEEPNYTITGNLTIKGITDEVSFPAFISVSGKKLVANGKITFDRTKWDIRYGSGSFFEGLGDKMIYDDVDLNFVLSANI